MEEIQATGEPTRTPAPHEPGRMPLQAKRAARAAFLGFAVDYFDIYLPVVALAPALHYFQSPSLSGTAGTTLFFLTFAVTLIGRPIGSAVFGSLSDRIGRRRSTLIAVAGFTVATFLMAALPGYADWGYGALAALMVLRLLGGVFMGGEYTSANPLALESCPTQKRGFVGALIAAAYPVGYMAISLVTLPLLQLLPAGGTGSAYVQWGWRIPFVVGGLLGVVFFWYFHRTVEESGAWTAAVQDRAAGAEDRGGVRKAPLRELFAAGNIRRLGQVFLLMSGLWFAVQSVVSPMSGLLISQLRQDPDAVTAGLLVANVALFAGYLTLGVLGQRYGRRKVLLLSGTGTATIAALTFFLAIRILDGGGNFPLAMVLYTVCLVVAVSPYGVATVYLLEAFPTHIRASGYGVAFSFSLVVPSFYSLYMLGLSAVMPYAYTPLVLIVLSGVLTVLGARLGPETKHLDLRPQPA
ncbi:MFS transporter [Streptomyces sp. NBC_01089]|uniref:MFS transporter n=1 Tax=Streptomyces sp. NBC_01089 TaxID=2903747 RepID=UPI00386AE1C2|nr:MFS transporter [Streptomyces sp. NBC_01089]